MNFPWWKSLLWNALVLFGLPILIVGALLPRRPRWLVWGSMPLISNMYWSAAMKRAGFDSLTMMQDSYAIFGRDSFDVYFDEIPPLWLPKLVRRGVGALSALLFVLREAKVVHVSFHGFALDNSWFWWLEPRLFHLAGVRIVAMPYGADFYRFSTIPDTAFRHALNASYPGLARIEPRIARRASMWSLQADAVVSGMMIEGQGRWDVTLNQFFHIDESQWTPKPNHSDADGVNGPVRVMHAPNHRGFKGTEFVVEAVKQLQDEGLKVELVMLEGVSNAEVKARMQEVDILAEQFIATGYAFNAIEGMASGLPVLANLDHEAYTRVFRRYGFLDECPILSSPPERLKENIRLLVGNPGLRAELGRAGRAFVEKYHSYKAAQYLFGSIYKRILDGEDIDLINLFHPLKSDYVRGSPRIAHPLVENRLPADWAQQ